MKIISIITTVLFSTYAFAYQKNCTVSYRAGTSEVTAKISGENNETFFFTSYSETGSKIVDSARFEKTKFGNGFAYVEKTNLIPGYPAYASFNNGDLDITRYSTIDSGTTYIERYGYYHCK